MRHDKQIKLEPKNQFIIFLAILCPILGCAQDSPNWFGTKTRIFGAKPNTVAASETPKKISSSQTPRVAYPTTQKSNDPQVQVAEKKVNDQVERLIQAMEQSRKSETTGMSMQTAQTVGDSDSLAAKLAQTQQKTYPINAAPSEEKPVLTKPSIHPKKFAPIPENSKPPIRITKVEPVSVDKPEPEKPPTPLIAEPQPKINPIPIKPAPANTAAKLDIPDPGNPNAALDTLLFQLEQKIKDRPEDTASLVKLRLIYAVLGQWQQAIKEKGGKDTTGGEMAKNIAALVKVFDNADLNPAEQANQALKIVELLQDMLRRQADLVICNFQLCREVSSFGCFKLMPREYFVTGKNLPIIIYLELENFTSKYLPDKKNYQTLLSLTIEVLSASGKVCWKQHYDQIEDLSNKHRRDFYLAPSVTLPPNLPEGNLKLKITLEDLNGNKVAQRMTDMELKSR
ncbi:MAG: hypothetical protein WC975_02220 [Phycisphaerae bacterium]